MKENNAVQMLKDKVERLIDENRILRSELKKASDEREKGLRQRRNAEAKILELEHRLRVLETAAALTIQEGDTRAARQRINKLLREIDSCIALMNR